jgi:hypothetical protein
MAKSNRGNLSAVESNTPAATTEQVAEVTAVEAPRPNHTITFRRTHPGGGPLARCSYGIAGVSGIVVFDRALFVDGVMPETITLSCELVQPQPDAKQQKAEAQAAKAQAKAEAAQKKIEAAAAKAAERQAKADKALADAKAKVEAAQAALGSKAAEPATV